jgi:lipopolysaccharide transport protein LptA
MKKIFVVLLSVCGCVALAQKNAPLTRAWTPRTPVTNILVTNVPVTNELATRALIMNALATNTVITHASVTNALVADVPVPNAPATSLPVPPALVSQAPVTNALITPVIATNALIAEVLVANAPTTDTPATNLPAAKELMTNALVVSAPVTNVPVTLMPVTNAPVAITPATSVPVLNTAGAQPAATNTPAQPAALDIISDSWDFDQNMRQTVYHGHVRVTDAQMRLTCEQLTAIFPENNGRHLERVLAETNVVIDFTDEQGEKYHVTAAKAVYVYKVVNATTNETVTLTGSPKITQGVTNFITGEPLYYTRVNRQKGMLSGSNIQTHFAQPPAGTNTDASPVKLF